MDSLPLNTPIPSSTITQLDVAGTGGPMLLAYLFTWGLQGIMIVQIYNYYIAFPRDAIWYKILVYGIFLLETVQTIIVTWDAFNTFALGFGNIPGLSAVRFSWLDVPVVGGIVGLISNLFYAYRITLLSRSYIVGAIVATMALVSQSAAVVAGVLIRQHGTLLHVNERPIFVTTAIWLTGSAASDIVITAFMIYFLVRRDTGFRRTHLLVNKILLATIETNATTAIVATVGAICFLHFPEHDYYVTAGTSLAKLYANTLFFNINDRMQIVGGRSMFGCTEDHQTVSFLGQRPFSTNTRNSVKLAFKLGAPSKAPQRQRDLDQFVAAENSQHRDEDGGCSLRDFGGRPDSRKVLLVA